MAYTKTINDADTYFGRGNHLASDVWEAADTDKKKSAFAYARRWLERLRNRELADPGSTTDNDIIREDYAHFEMTLYFLLVNPFRANSNNAGQQYDLGAPDGEAAASLTYNPKSEAFKWLGMNSNMIFRG